MQQPSWILEEVTDPEEVAHARTQHERQLRNSHWLQAHWADVLPEARGKFVAVAGEEACIAETSAEAWAWVEAQHPEDNGAFVRYVRLDRGPRIYAYRG